MGFRTVIINSRCKLEYKLNYLVVRGETEKRIFINEISTLIVQSTAVSLTAALLSELVKNNVSVIFCDEKCNPAAELLPYYSAHNTSKRIKRQIKWGNDIKGEVWQKIIRRKISTERDLLVKKGFYTEADILNEYFFEVEKFDSTNREGHSAKVYFNRILPDGVTRRCGGFLNGCLNYGYAVVLSAINREIVAGGYLTQLGIWHDNEFNQFNLGSDLIEPVRSFIDEVALDIADGDERFKSIMANVLNLEMKIDGQKTTFDIAIRQYVRSVFYALENNDADAVVFPEKI